MKKTERRIFSGNIARVVDDDGVIHDGNRIIVENIVEVKSKTHEHLKGARYVKLYDVVVPKLIERLSSTEISLVLLLSPLVSYEDCIVRKGNSRHYDVATGKEIAELINMDYSKFRRTAASLITKGVIGRHETGTILDDYYGKRTKAYTVNPYIYFRGMNIKTSIADLYNNSGWKELYEDKYDS